MDLTQTFPVRSPQIVVQQTGDETVIVVPARGKAEVINALGSFIWAQIDNTRSVQEIVLAVCAEYDVTEEQAGQDALRFLQSLEQKGVIQLSAQPGH